MEPMRAKLLGPEFPESNSMGPVAVSSSHQARIGVPYASTRSGRAQLPHESDCLIAVAEAGWVWAT